MNLRRVHFALVACCAAALMARSGMAQIGTELTYQGELRLDGSIANGQYDMTFQAFNAATGNDPLGSPLQAVVTVVDGRFTVLLDFGSVLGNRPSFIEIRARAAGSTDPYTTLTPRQPLTAVPNAGFASVSNIANFANGSENANLFANEPPSYYLNAANLSTGVLADARIGTSIPRIGNTQTFTGINTFSHPSNAFTGIFTGNGAALSNLNASNITTGTLANARTTATPNASNNTLVMRDGAGNFAAGAISATALLGDGSALTNLNASNITSGTLANARTSGTGAATPNTLVLRDGSGGFAVNGLAVGTITGNGQFLTNINASNIALGTLAAARLPATAARTDIGNAFGNFTNTFAGFVGVGTTTPGAPLHVADSGVDIAIFGPTAAGSAQLMLGTSAATDGYATIQGVRAAGSTWGDLVLSPLAGNVGVGIPTPLGRFHVRSPGNIATVIDSDSNTGTWLAINNRAGAVGNQRFWSLLNTAPGNGTAGNLQFVVGSALGVADAIPMVINRDGNVGIGTTTPATKLHVVGTTRTSILEITGGSDIAEPYCVAGTDGLEPAPGMVVSIDPDHVGKLRVSTNAYDTTVAGIISGANGVNVGLTLRQEGSTVADGSMPIANVGRVWCLVDASSGPVQPGDLLTTSSTPGHAMKADPSRANGAILGKAMSRLDSGKGMVLVLVGLQ